MTAPPRSIRCLLLLCLLLALVSCVHGQEAQTCDNVEGGGGVCAGDENSSVPPDTESAPTTDEDGNNKAAATSSNEQQDTPSSQHLQCGMYMAESSIPNSGWGMYTAVERNKHDYIFPVDVVIQVADLKSHLAMRQHYDDKPPLPKWLLHEYFWNPETTHAWYDAHKLHSIVPGLGMLANSHPGLVNSKEEGPLVKNIVARDSPEAGAYSEYKNQSFYATHTIPPGHELLVEYGDRWFEGRSKKWGITIPLSYDFEKADEVVSKIHEFCNSTLTTPFCKDLWHLIRHDLQPILSPRLLEALPESLQDIKTVLETGTARHLTPNVIRSLEWLSKHGLCLDHMEPKPSTVEHAGSGAFATRFLPKGTIVAPAPVVHLHRGHMELFYPDPNDPEQVHWRGFQLLLNYLYGHPSTSLLFFPYSPVVNFINHSPNEPNVELRWSDRMAHPEWKNLTTEDLIHENTHAGLMMELVALRDIEEEEEILLNYGSDWQEAWERHVREQWREPLNSDTYQPAEAFRREPMLPVQNDDDDNEASSLPSNVMTVCWIDWDHLEATDDEGVYVWLPSTEISLLDDAYPCRLLERYNDDDENKVYYRAEVKMEDGRIIVQDILRRAIDVVDKPYTSNQMLRQAFRHYIQLPDDMIPDEWKDLEHSTPKPPQCQLYMAESTIPNSGLGMYSGTSVIKEGRDITYGEIVIQAEDPDENHDLRRWTAGIYEEGAEPLWMMEHYFWNPDFSGGDLEAHETQSIVPGIGMLANSVTGKFNAHSRRASRDNAGLTPQKDPGAGASTSYHGFRFVAHNGDIEPGTEIFVEYGDTWFSDHKSTVGVIPLSTDFTKADQLLMEFWDDIGGDVDTEQAKEAWKTFLEEACNVSEDDDDDDDDDDEEEDRHHKMMMKRRVCMALPKDLEDVEDILDTGTAAYSVRNAVRSIDWLEENGRCLDNIEPRKSTIPQAGQGAFATRHIAQGSVVAPAPLVHLNQNQMEVYENVEDEDGEANVYRVGTQLLLNYCFGHQNSSILLYPYSPTVSYINHHHDNYNVELRWSSLPNHKRDWFNKTVDELMWITHTGLIMEFVATRNIEAGEEILVNYGDRWEKAWTEYVESWKPDPHYQSYVPAWTFNDYTLPVRTQVEQATDPYPPHVFIGCYLGAVDEMQSGAIVDGKLTYKWEEPASVYYTTLDVTECEIMKREKDSLDTADSIRPVNEKYTIKVWRHPQIPWLITNVPRRAIEFFDRYYTSELFLRSAFRHQMDLPDEMLPPAWNDLGGDADDG